LPCFDHVLSLAARLNQELVPNPLGLPLALLDDRLGLPPGGGQDLLVLVQRFLRILASPLRPVERFLHGALPLFEHAQERLPGIPAQQERQDYEGDDRPDDGPGFGLYQS
jgi:hypothetical protein